MTQVREEIWIKIQHIKSRHITDFIDFKEGECKCNVGVGRRTTFFFKLQLQEDINFFACFPSPDILYSSSPESGDPDPRPDLVLILVLLLQLLLLFLPLFLPLLTFFISPFLLLVDVYSILLISCCSFPPPSSPLPPISKGLVLPFW